MSRTTWVYIVFMLLSVVLVVTVILVPRQAWLRLMDNDSDNPFKSLPEGITVAVERNYYPFAYLDPKGQLVGFDVDVARYVCEHMQLKCNITMMRLSDIPAALTANEVQMSVASISYTPDANETLSYSLPYYRNKLLFIGRVNRYPPFVPDNTSYGERYTVGVRAGTNQQHWLLQHYPAISNIVVYPDLFSLVKAMYNGDIDMICVGSYVGYEIIKNTTHGYYDEVPFADITLVPSQSAHIVVSKQNEEQIEAINDALQQMYLSGTYQSLAYRAFSFML